MDGLCNRNRLCYACVPRAIGFVDGPLPAFRGAGRGTVQHGRTISSNPEDGRVRLRNLAPQAVILFDVWHRQTSQEIALCGVLDLAPSSA